MTAASCATVQTYVWKLHNHLKIRKSFHQPRVVESWVQAHSNTSTIHSHNQGYQFKNCLIDRYDNTSHHSVKQIKLNSVIESRIMQEKNRSELFVAADDCTSIHVTRQEHQRLPCFYWQISQMELIREMTTVLHSGA